MISFISNTVIKPPPTLQLHPLRLLLLPIPLPNPLEWGLLFCQQWIYPPDSPSTI